MSRKLKFRQEAGEPDRKEEAEVAKKVVIDHAAMREAVRVIREFQKEYGITILSPKGLDQASSILKRHENEDKLQNFVVNLVDAKLTEKIAPIDKKINRLTEMVSSMMAEVEEPVPQQMLKNAPDYVRKQTKVE